MFWLTVFVASYAEPFGNALHVTFRREGLPIVIVVVTQLVTSARREIPPFTQIDERNLLASLPDSTQGQAWKEHGTSKAAEVSRSYGSLWG